MAQYPQGVRLNFAPPPGDGTWKIVEGNYFCYGQSGLNDQLAKNGFGRESLKQRASTL